MIALLGQVAEAFAIDPCPDAGFALRRYRTAC